MTEHEVRTRFTCYAEELREIQGRVLALMSFIHDTTDYQSANFMQATIGSATEFGEALSRPAFNQQTIPNTKESNGRED